MAGLEKSMAKSGARFQSIGRDLTTGLTLPIVALGGSAAKAAMDFEQAFSGVSKTVDGIATKDGKLTAFGTKLQQQFRDLAKTIPVSVNELAKIGETAGAMGIPKEAILSFTEVMAKLGATTNVTSDQAAASIGKIQNVYQAAGVDTDRFAASLVALGNAGASTEADILNFAERMGGAAVQANISQAEVLGWANAMASVGLNAELGSTAWNKVTSAIGKAVDLGGDKLALFAKTAGMTSAAFTNLFKSDASEAVNRLVEGFGRVSASGGNLTKTMEDMGFKTSGIQMTFKNLASSGDMVRNSLDMGKKAWQDNVAMEEEFSKKSATTISQLKILFNQLYDVGIQLGGPLIEGFKNMMPALETTLSGLASMVKWFSELPTGIQTATFAFAGLLAALGPIALAFGTILTTGASVIKLLREAGALAPGAGVGAGGAPAGGAGAPAGGLSAGWGPFAMGFAMQGTRDAQDLNTEGRLHLPEGWDSYGGKAAPSGPVKDFDPRVGPTIANQFSASIGPTVNLTDKFSALAAAAKTAHGAVGNPGGLGAGLDGVAASATKAARAISAVEAQFTAANRSTEAFYATVSQDMLRQGIKDPKAATLFSDQNNALGALPMSPMLDANGTRLQTPTTNVGLEGAGKSLADLTGPIAPAVSAQLKAGFTSAVSSLPQTIMAALQGGGDVGKSIGGLFGGEIVGSMAGKLTGQLSGMFGKTIGGALGSVVPGLGTMLGSMIGPMIGKLAGKIWGGIKGIFGQDEESKSVNPARDKFMSQFGDVSNRDVGGAQHNLAAKLTEITGQAGGGTLFAALQGADTMAEFNAAMTAVQDALAQSQTKATDAISATDAAADGFNLTLQGSDEALARLGETQERITATMLVGFDNLIAKLSEFMATLTMAYAMPMPGAPAYAGMPSGAAPDYQPIAREDMAVGGGVVINAGTIIGNPDELAMMVTNAWEGGGDAYNAFRIMTNQANES